MERPDQQMTERQMFFLAYVPWSRIVCCLAVLVLSVPGVLADQPKEAGIERRERSMSMHDLELGQLPDFRVWRKIRLEVPQNLNGMLYTPPAKLRGWAFYGRRKDRGKWFLVSQDPDGTVVFADNQQVLQVEPAKARLEPDPELHFTFFSRGMTVDFGGRLLFETSSIKGWEFFWINVGKHVPISTKLYRVDFEDGFMRTTFAKGDRWDIRSGIWNLKQYGGGMPTDEAEARNPGYRRAANAFTLVGANGEACYGRERWTNLYAEARFFFGRSDSYAKRDTLVGTRLGGEPSYADKQAIYKSNQIHEYPDSDFFVAQGKAGGYRVSFGWSAQKHCFQLRRQSPGSRDWEVVRKWAFRPPFTNWVRIGLGMSRGCRALPFLDGEQLGAFPQDFVVRGPVALISGKGKSEADDVAVWSYPRAAVLGAPVFEKSVHFAQKELLKVKDRQTGQWTRSELTFDDEQARLRGREMNLKRCQFPIFGDFTYRTGPNVPPGEYCFAVVDHQERPFYTGFFTKDEKGWQVPGGLPEFMLEIGRRKGHIVRRTGGRWQLLTTRQVSRPVWLVLGAKGDAPLDSADHLIYSHSLEQEFFEQAPTDWVSREGNFRMDVRWQCQRGWNFMMGKSRDVAVMYSKTAYSGTQEIEFYIALRFCVPPPYYILRDMGVAFCTDGKSLASGYALIYGDCDNTQTTLLRKGQPVRQSSHHIRPKAGGNIHNYWWHGKICKDGNKITVEIDDQKIFEFTDRNPLSGGHLAFWTFRNSISLAKVSVNAEESVSRPELFRLPAEPLSQGIWQPLNPDEVTVKRLPSGRWKAVNQIGGGCFALRCHFPGKGVDLNATPRLTLPFKRGRHTRVGIHLQVSGKSFYYPLTAPTKGLRYLLTPQFENAEPEKIYRQAFFTEEEVKQFLVPGRANNSEVTLDLRQLARKLKPARLESITVGNSSNHEYLLLGAGGNPPGSTYIVGKPKWRR